MARRVFFNCSFAAFFRRHRLIKFIMEKMIIRLKKKLAALENIWETLNCNSFGNGNCIEDCGLYDAR